MRNVGVSSFLCCYGDFHSKHGLKQTLLAAEQNNQALQFKIFKHFCNEQFYVFFIKFIYFFTLGHIDIIKKCC